MHAGICKGVLKVGPCEAQKDLNSESQKIAHRHCEAQFHEDFRLHLARFWRSLGTFFGGCLWSNLSRKDSKIQWLMYRDERPAVLCLLAREAAGARSCSEAQK